MKLSEVFKEFSQSVFNARTQFIQILDGLGSTGRVIGFGASATTTLSHAWQIGDRFHSLMDNRHKQNTRRPGYGLMSSAFTIASLTWMTQ